MTSAPSAPGPLSDAGEGSGRLRTYLGIAPGVGKTYAMLADAGRDAGTGLDVVIGYLEHKGRADTAAQAAGLEVVPTRTVTYRGTAFDEMDVDALVRRRPAVAVVDEIAHRNVPGSARTHRWNDVSALLDAGIDVRTTLNLANMASLEDIVARVTGTRPTETVPDDLVASGEVRLVDLPPEALRRRLAAGRVVPAAQAGAALGGWFRHANLAALRELAQLWVDDAVADVAATFAHRHLDLFPEAHRRIVVGLSGVEGDELLAGFAVELARIDAVRVVGVHVRGAGLRTPGSDDLAASEAIIAAADGELIEVLDDDPGGALVRTARQLDAAQLIVGSSRGSRWRHLSRGSTVRRVLRLAGDDLPVQVVPCASSGQDQHA